jgi:serine/threonine-protein kinase RsbW
VSQQPDTSVSISSGPLVGPVLRRVVGMLAARADLPLDRLDEAVLIADVIASRAPAFAPEYVQVRIRPEPHELWIDVGPLDAGGADALLAEAAHDVPSVIAKLADDVRVDAGDGRGEMLRVCVAYRG